jgi:hypothetical protein
MGDDRSALLATRAKTKGETLMTTLLNSLAHSDRIVSGLRRLGSTVGNAIDTYAEYRMRNAVSHWEGRRSDSEISRYRAMLSLR